MGISAGFREQFVSILWIQNAGPPRQEESLALASRRKSLKFGTRRRRCEDYSDLAAERFAKTSWPRRTRMGPLGGDGDQRARAENKKRKNKRGPEKAGGRTKVSRGKVRGDGQTVKGFNRRTESKNWRYRRHSVNIARRHDTREIARG